MSKESKEIEVLSEMQKENDEIALAKQQITEDIKLAHEMSGRRQMVANLSKLLTVVDIVELQRIKESKAFKHLRNPESADAASFKTWAEFCEVAVGESRQTIDEKILNLKTFGTEAIESMNTIGLGVRQLRQLRKLPEDQLEQAKALAEENDKESLLDLIEEQTAQKAKLEEQLQKTQKVAEEESQAAESLLEKKDKKINEQAKQLEKRALELELNGWEAQVDEINIAITKEAGKASVDLDNLDLLLDTIQTLQLDEEHRAAAHERMATNYIAVMKSLTIKIDQMMNKTLSTIGAYEDRAIPLLERFYQDNEE